MFVGPLYKERQASASGNHVFEIDDVLDYPIPAKKPAIEIGKLIDDISVRAILLTDVSDSLTTSDAPLDGEAVAAKCLGGAQKLAARINGVLGRQSSMVVFIGNVPATEATYGCPFGPKNAPDFSVAWDHQARPPAATAELIGKGGEYLTGASTAELKQELAACVAEALKKESGELANREFRGVKIECQAFTRDGGGGSATIYRRFGAYPVHDMPGAKVLSDMKHASAALATVEDAKAAEAVRFAKWWLDPTIPTKVKTFMMVAARIQALADRCPTWKPNYAVITDAATFAGISVQDIKPGGKYFDTFVSMMGEMTKGTESESREEACQTAKKSYGEASGD